MRMRDGRAWRLTAWLGLMLSSCALAQGDAPPELVDSRSRLPPLLQDRPATATTQLAPRIGLITMAPGIDYWARFGHNAILVDDGATRTLYNYGYFDFAQPGFLTRFLRGRMLYQLVALPMEADLRGYAEDGRGVQLQWLDIAPAQAIELDAFLQWNARPENAEYRYDYFVDNCSTRVRDALDRALGGALKRTLSGRSHGLTFRDEARRLAASLPWMYLGIHLGLGPFTDKPMSLWEESYVPMRLHDAISESRAASGGPLVLAEVQVLPQVIEPARATPPSWRGWFALAGMSIAGLLAFSFRPAASKLARRSGAVTTAALWMVCGLVGVGLLSLWAFTDHAAAWGNENALLFNPLCLALLPAARRLARGMAPTRLARRVAFAVAASAGIALFLKFLPFRIQSNGDWIALMLPIHAALAWRISSASSQPPATPL